MTNPESPYAVLSMEWTDRSVIITFVDTALDTRSVSQVRSLHLDPDHERFARGIAEIVESVEDLISEAEDERRGTPLTRPARQRPE